VSVRISSLTAFRDQFHRALTTFFVLQVDNSDMVQSVTIGGREVIGFVEQSEVGGNRIKSVTPVPADSQWAGVFGNHQTGTVRFLGIESRYGRRIADAYQDGRLPTNDTDELNAILRKGVEA
jgi:hypothetical protein